MSERTELQREILVTAYDHPELSQVEVANHVGCSASYVSNVLNDYDSHDAMEARIEQLGGRNGMDLGIGGLSGSDSGSDLETGDIEDLPPIGFAGIGAIVAVLLLLSEGLMASRPTLRWGVILAGVSLPVFVSAAFYRKYSTDGLSSATTWLFGSDTSRPDSKSGTSSKKTPPAPQSLKDDLYFDRAEKQCEWCETRIDSPDVHHITPRSENGGNEPTNLIVLCPNCHRKADRGIISQSKLRRAISR